QVHRVIARPARNGVERIFPLALLAGLGVEMLKLRHYLRILARVEVLIEEPHVHRARLAEDRLRMLKRHLGPLGGIAEQAGPTRLDDDLAPEAHELLVLIVPPPAPGFIGTEPEDLPLAVCVGSNDRHRLVLALLADLRGARVDNK